jgi:hypothetical protein
MVRLSKIVGYLIDNDCVIMLSDVEERGQEEIGRTAGPGSKLGSQGCAGSDIEMGLESLKFVLVAFSPLTLPQGERGKGWGSAACFMLV